MDRRNPGGNDLDDHVSAYVYLRSTLADYSGEITVPGIIQPVEIIRDTYGMPHILLCPVKILQK
jgi:hypothetical protein